MVFLRQTDFSLRAEIESKIYFPTIIPPPELVEAWERIRAMYEAMHGVTERKIGNTWYTIWTDCDGRERLTDKIKRLIFSETFPWFAGIMFCADCGKRMHFATCKSFEGKQDHYVCSAYKSGRGECSCHYIREDVMRSIVLECIRAVTAHIRKDAEAFQEEWLQSTRKAQDSSIRQNQKQLAKAKKRLEDIDTLITRLYEDHVLGSLSDDRYQKMTTDYEAEQERLKTEIAVMEEWIDQQQEDNDNYDRFAALVEKYVDIPELTTTIVNEFVKKIIVHEADKSSGHRRQTIEIVFNFVGKVEIPILTEPVILDSVSTQRKTA